MMLSYPDRKNTASAFSLRIETDKPYLQKWAALRNDSSQLTRILLLLLIYNLKLYFSRCEKYS